VQHFHARKLDEKLIHQRIRCIRAPEDGGGWAPDTLLLRLSPTLTILQKAWKRKYVFRLRLPREIIQQSQSVIEPSSPPMRTSRFTTLFALCISRPLALADTSQAQLVLAEPTFRLASPSFTEFYYAVLPTSKTKHITKQQNPLPHQHSTTPTK